MKALSKSLLLLAGILLLAGCQKEGRFGNDKSLIRFSATSVPETKAVYSGETVTEGTGQNAHTYERIDWQAGDNIRIWSPEAFDRYHESQENGKHYADYKVTNVSTGTGSNLRKSYASIVNISETFGEDNANGLIWGDAGNYTFFASYPIPNTTASLSDPIGTISLSLDANQNLDLHTYSTDKKIWEPDGDKVPAFMTAAAQVTTTVDGEGVPVELEFYPAFTAFEFTLTADMPLTLKTFTLSSAGTGATSLSGAFKVIYDDGLNATYDCSAATGKSISVQFPKENAEDQVAGLKIDENQPRSFTVYALPQDLKNLTITFTVRADDWTKDETRKLVLNYKNGTPVTFGARMKHKIKGEMQGAYNFKYITLTGEALDWEAVTVTEASDNLPQSSQFAVSDAKNGRDITGVKEDRQTWVFQDIYPLNNHDGNFDPVTVSYKVFAPAGGTWELIPQGEDIAKFKIEVNTGVEGDQLIWTEIHENGISGEIRSKEDESRFGTTKVLFKIVPRNPVVEGAEQARIWFKTYVYDGANKTGTKYSLDSETQLYDTRGYHYFQTYNPTH